MNKRNLIGLFVKKHLGTKPIEGAELVTNPGFEGVYVGGIAPNYSGAGGTPSESATAHGGSKAQQINNGTGAAGNIFGTDIALTAGDWVQYSLWMKALAGQGHFKIYQNFGGYANIAVHNPPITSMAYIQNLITTRVPTTGNHTPCLYADSNATADVNSILGDDMSAKVLTLSSLFSNHKTASSDSSAQVDIIFVSGTQAGVFANLDSVVSPANFVIGYLYNTELAANKQCRLDKCVAGTYTNIIDGAVTYVPGASLKVIKSGTDYELWYNGSQVGATSTIADAGIVDNILFGIFSTYADNKFSHLVIN